MTTDVVAAVVAVATAAAVTATTRTGMTVPGQEQPFHLSFLAAKPNSGKLSSSRRRCRR